MRLTHGIHLRIALLMIFALLSAQLGAQAHAYSHLRASSHAADSLPGHDGGCLECLSFAPLLSAAGGPGHSIWSAAQQLFHAPLDVAPWGAPAAPTPAFRSRAPPTGH